MKAYEFFFKSKYFFVCTRKALVVCTLHPKLLAGVGYGVVRQVRLESQTDFTPVYVGFCGHRGAR